MHGTYTFTEKKCFSNEKKLYNFPSRFFTLPSTCVGNVSVFALDIYLDKVQSRSIYLYRIGQSGNSFLIPTVEVCTCNKHAEFQYFSKDLPCYSQCMCESRGTRGRQGGPDPPSYPLKFKLKKNILIFLK